MQKEGRMVTAVMAKVLPFEAPPFADTIGVFLEDP